jgi:hypothetical protein
MSALPALFKAIKRPSPAAATACQRLEEGVTDPNPMLSELRAIQVIPSDEVAMVFWVEYEGTQHASFAALGRPPKQGPEQKCW